MATQNSPYAIPSTIDSMILATTKAYYENRNTDNVYNDNVLLGVLNSRSKEMISGGASIVEPLLEKQQNNGGFYLGDDTLSTTQDRTQTVVEYKWQNMYEPIQITRDEERANSSTPEKIVDLYGAKLMSAEKAISLRAEQAFSRPIAGANNLNDLETICGTGTLGTINGATDTFWQATVVTSGDFTTQGITDMTTAYYAVASSSTSDTPDLIITTSSIFQDYEKNLIPQDRISNGALSANLGYETLSFKGKPVVYGNEISTGKMFLLNLNYLKLYVDSETDFIMTELMQAFNQTSKVSYMLWRGNLGTNNRRRLAKLQSIT